MLLYIIYSSSDDEMKKKYNIDNKEIRYNSKIKSYTQSNLKPVILYCFDESTQIYWNTLVCDSSRLILFLFFIFKKTYVHLRFIDIHYDVISIYRCQITLINLLINFISYSSTSVTDALSTNHPSC